MTITVPNAVVANDDASVTPQNMPVTTDVLANDTISLGGAPFNIGSLTVPEGSGPTHGTVDVEDGRSPTSPTPDTPAPTATPTGSATPPPPTRCAWSRRSTSPSVRTSWWPVPMRSSLPRPRRSRSRCWATTPARPVSRWTRPRSRSRRRPATAPRLIDPTTGAVTYTPAARFSGVDTFNYQVCDTSNPTPVCATHVGDDHRAEHGHRGRRRGGDAGEHRDQDLHPGQRHHHARWRAVGSGLGDDRRSAGQRQGHGEQGRHRALHTERRLHGQDSFDYRVCDTAVPVPNCADATVTITIQKTGLSIVREGIRQGHHHDGIVSVGDTIDYTFTVTNIGVGLVRRRGCVDPMIGSVSCPATELAAGKEMVCTSDAGHVITAADATSGRVTNSAVAVGAPSCPTPPAGLRRTALTAAASRPAARPWCRSSRTPAPS